MTSRADKTSRTVTATHSPAANQPFFRSAAGTGFFAAARPGPGVQMKMSVSKEGDPLEREADRMAGQVMRAPPAAAAGGWQGAPPALQRKESGAAPAVDGHTETAIGNQAAGGAPLSGEVRGLMEPRFGADFSNVRIHTDAQAASLNNQLSARAFTYQNHVFFSRDQYQPGTSEGRQLLAHELTHTIQQGHAVQRSPQVGVAGSTPSIQRLGKQDALDYFADKAQWLPGFPLLCIIIGFNPINLRKADRSAANILRAIIELAPVGKLITTALDKYGILTKAGVWVEKQFATLGDIGGQVVDGLKKFIDSLKWSDIIHLDDVWERGKAVLKKPAERLLAFGGELVTGLLKLVREAILTPLAKLAQATDGYDLLKAVLEEDPITGDYVARTADTLIGGFMKLIGQADIWDNIKKGKAKERAWNWFQGALKGLKAIVSAIPGKIVKTIKDITWVDVVTIAGVYVKVGKAFLNIVTDFFTWGGAQVLSLLEILFSVVAPHAIPYIAKAQGAFRTIIKDPVRFVGNLVRAGKLGFQMFASNIGAHLKKALIKWLIGPLADAGVYIPKSFELLEIVKLILSVLGLTWQNIRTKLLKIMPEPVLQVLEKSAGILVTLVRDGPAAAWDQIKAELTEAKDMMIAKITEMITIEVVKAAVMKLVNMINPAGAVLEAILAVYNTIMFFVTKIKQIGAVVASFIDSIAAIAGGQVDNAARKVELTMANTLTVIIAFLAQFAGLGNIPTKLVAIVMKVRNFIDKGMDKIVAWLGNLLGKGKQALAAVFEWWKKRFSFKNAAGKSHTISFKGVEDAAVLMIETTPVPLVTYLKEYERDKKPDGAKKTVIESIRAMVKEIEKLKTSSGKRAGRSAFTKEEGMAIGALFEKIGAALRELHDGPIPPTKVEWNNPKEDGVHMLAFPLSIDSGGLAGSQPTQESALWKWANAKWPGEYVRGHLLNHHLHGEGTKKNLIPITRAANRRMEALAEGPIKEAVLDKRKTVVYEVTMVLGNPRSAELPKAITVQAAEIEQVNDAWQAKNTFVSTSILSV